MSMTGIFFIIGGRHIFYAYFIFGHLITLTLSRMYEMDFGDF